MPFVLTVSPEQGWNIPVSLIDKERFKNELLGIGFKAFKFKSYPSTQVSDADVRTVKKEGRQPEQEEYHSKNNYPLFTDVNRSDRLKTSGVVPVPEQGEGFVCKDIYSHEPENEALARYTYPETLALIESNAQAVNREFHTSKVGLPAHWEIRLVLNALGRTEEYQDVLIRNGNGNATQSNSSHEYYNAVDISRLQAIVVDTRTQAEVQVTADSNSRFFESMDAILHRELAKAIREGRAFGARERGQACYHVVGRRLGH